MKIYKPTIYDEFICAASDCTDTCCRFWQVVLDDEFLSKVNDFPTSQNSRKILKSKVNGFGKNKHLSLCKNGNCPFLNDKLLCDLHKEIGNESLPETCRRYPRFINNFGAYEERGLSFSCPVAAKLMKENGLVFKLTENDNVPICYTEVGAELFVFVRVARNHIINHLTSSDEDVEDMIGSIIDFSKRVQVAINSHEFTNNEITKGSKSDYLNNTNELKKALKLHFNNVTLKQEFADKLKNASLPDNINKSAFILWLKYFIFKHLIMAAYDKEFLGRVKASIVSFYVIASLDGDIFENMQVYAKETEHNEKNMKRLMSFAKKIKI